MHSDEESSCSSDAAAILIRSTRIQFRGHGSQRIQFHDQGHESQRILSPDLEELKSQRIQFPDPEEHKCQRIQFHDQEEHEFQTIQFHDRGHEFPVELRGSVTPAPSNVVPEQIPVQSLSQEQQQQQQQRQQQKQQQQKQQQQKQQQQKQQQQQQQQQQQKQQQQCSTRIEEVKQPRQKVNQERRQNRSVTSRATKENQDPGRHRSLITDRLSSARGAGPARGGGLARGSGSTRGSSTARGAGPGPLPASGFRAGPARRAGSARTAGTGPLTAASGLRAGSVLEPEPGPLTGSGSAAGSGVVTAGSGPVDGSGVVTAGSGPVDGSGVVTAGSGPVDGSGVVTAVSSPLDGPGVVEAGSGPVDGSGVDACPGSEVLISHYPAGERGVVLAALNKRSQSAPMRREVKVQLLEPGPFGLRKEESPMGVPTGLDVPSRLDVPSGLDAMVTAAAVAATAPLIKAQGNLEMRMSQVADSLRTLVVTNREEGARRSREEENRVSLRLEQQLSRLEELDKMQQNHLQLQSRLLSSSLGVAVTGPVTRPDPSLPNPPPNQPAPEDTHTVPSTSIPSTQQTQQGSRRGMEDQPVPSTSIPSTQQTQRGSRRGMEEQPVPRSSAHNAKRRKDTMQGHDRRSEAVPGSSQRNLATSQRNQATSQRNLATGASTSESHEVTMATAQQDCRPDQSSGTQQRPLQATTTETLTHAGSVAANQSEAAVSQANQVLREMSRLRSEVKNLLADGVSLPISSMVCPGLSRNMEVSSATQTTPPTPTPAPPSVSTRAAVQGGGAPPSVLEEAGQVLQQVRRRRKVVEDNLEVMTRHTLHTHLLNAQLNALENNRDSSEELRIKKTVNAWISTLRETQAEPTTVTTTNKDVSKSKDASLTAKKSKEGRLLGMLRRPGSKPRGVVVLTNVQDGQSDRPRDPERLAHRGGGGGGGGGRGGEQGCEGAQGEAYLQQLYGRALYEGHRRTLDIKKGPYLRFSSPGSPRPRGPPRPRLVERVKGVKLKSCKTQTNMAPPPAPPILSPPDPSPRQRPLYYTVGPSHTVPCSDPRDLPTTAMEQGPPTVPMAVPLGHCQPRIDRSPPRPSRVLFSTPGPEVIPSSSPSSSCEPPHPPHPPPPLSPKQTDVVLMEVCSGDLEVAQPEDQVEDHERNSQEENTFPGSQFMAVVDVVQGEDSALVDEVIELEGQASPPVTMYHGPVFPPRSRSPVPAQDQASLLDPTQPRETLENRLVEWVEQQLMARMISEMYRPPPPDPAQNQYASQSDGEESVAVSDIVECAGAEGVQLLVDCGVPVNSDLIRQFVNEALAETISLMLGHTDTHTTTTTAAAPAVTQHTLPEERLVCTPVVTPEPMAASPVMPSEELSPLGTPQASESCSLELSPREEHTLTPQRLSHTEDDPEPVATPPSTPPRPAATPTNTPPAHVDTPTSTPPPRDTPLEVSAAEEEVVVPSSPPPPPPPAPIRVPEPPASPPCSTEDSTSSTSVSSITSSSTSSATGMNSAVKQISEGEVLLTSFNQLAVLEEEGLCLPDVNSFSSSLQEVLDMDLDPPTDGQVRQSAPRDPILALLAKIEQGVNAHTDPRPQPEGSWEEGEVRGGEEEVSMGEVMEERTTKRQHTKTTVPSSSSAAAYSPTADVTQMTMESTNQGPLTIGELELGPIGRAVGTSDPHTDQSLSPSLIEDTPSEAQAVRPAAIMVRQYEERHTPAGQEEVEEESSRQRGVVPMRQPSVGEERG